MSLTIIPPQERFIDRIRKDNNRAELDRLTTITEVQQRLTEEVCMAIQTNTEIVKALTEKLRK